VSGCNGEPVTDGPFAEAVKAIVGDRKTGGETKGETKGENKDALALTTTTIGNSTPIAVADTGKKPNGTEKNEKKVIPPVFSTQTAWVCLRCAQLHLCIESHVTHYCSSDLIV
jgi:hypothetical protein